MPRKKSKNFINRTMQRYAENAHIQESRRLRSELRDLQMKYDCLECEHKMSKTETKMAKNEAKKAKPFLDNQQGKKKKNGA